MGFVLVFSFYALAGFLAVTERSPSIPGFIGMVTLGAVSLACCALIAARKTESHLTKILVVIGAFVVGGATTYAVSTPPEDFGWMTVIAIWILTVTILTDIALTGEAIQGPVARAVKYLGKGGDGKAAEERAIVERAAIRVLTPLLLIVSIIGAILIAANTSNVPSIAFGKHVAFAGLLVLVFFYGTLLILLPLVRGVISGEWPTELTIRGPRFQERDLALSKTAATELENHIKASDKRLRRLIRNSAAEAKVGLVSLTGRVARTEDRTTATAKAAADGILDLERRIEKLESQLDDGA
jgi:hypothetical protein